MSLTRPFRPLHVAGREVLVDFEGYICNVDEWSEAFAEALAKDEGLALTDAHWQVIRYLRDYYQAHGVQAQVRTMIRHFRDTWGPALGNNHHLHEMFPRGGPQKQGNRIAGLLRTKGEH